MTTFIPKRKRGHYFKFKQKWLSASGARPVLHAQNTKNKNNYKDNEKSFAYVKKKLGLFSFQRKYPYERQKCNPQK